MNVHVVTYFAENDLECKKDYVAVEVYVDGNLAAQYGNHYDDKGKEKAEAFVEALEYMGYYISIIYTIAHNWETKDES
jgi:hypothetical protein